MKKILVIESDPSLSGLICDSLNDAGYDAVACEPEQAVALAVELPASAIVAALSSAAIEQPPISRSLRRDPRTKGIPIILITGRGDATIRRRLGERPPLVLFKPFDFGELVTTVTRILGDTGTPELD